MAEYEEKDYGLTEARPLRDFVNEFIKAHATCRIKIRSGAPRYWFDRRPIHNVHCTMRYKNGTETFRSKNCTDAVLAMNVVRTRFDPEHGTIWIIVFAPYGRPKNWFSDRGGETGPEPPRATSCRAAVFADLLSEADDDELPF